MRITEQRTTAGIIVRAVDAEGNVLAERHVLTNRRCAGRMLARARRNVLRDAKQLMKERV